MPYEGLELDGTYQFLSYADDNNILGDKITIITKETTSC
jgi:hypothetical protein